MSPDEMMGIIYAATHSACVECNAREKILMRCSMQSISFLQLCHSCNANYLNYLAISQTRTLQSYLAISQNISTISQCKIYRNANYVNLESTLSCCSGADVTVYSQELRATVSKAKQPQQQSMSAPAWGARQLWGLSHCHSTLR